MSAGRLLWQQIAVTEMKELWHVTTSTRANQERLLNMCTTLKERYIKVSLHIITVESITLITIDNWLY